MSDYPGYGGQQQHRGFSGGYDDGGAAYGYGYGGPGYGGGGYGGGGGGARYNGGGGYGGGGYGGGGYAGGGGGGGGGDRALRSVFVGNIPYKATEDDLIQLFSQIGPVLSFRLVTDRETGRPKGYGFCEFADPNSASDALNKLNGYEFQGRSLRVDKSKGA